MNIGVAVETVAPDKLPDRRAIGKTSIGTIRSSGMEGVIMTALADIRTFLAQQFCVAAAMGSVADHTVFFDRWMFPHEWAALVSMAFKTEFVHAVCLDHLVAEAAVRIMAVVAGNLAFFDGMVRLAVDLGPDILVAGKTEFGLRHLQVFREIGVAGMTTGAGHARGLMSTGFPKSYMVGG